MRDVVAAKREAKAPAFGKDEVYLEKLVERARHVEVQILGDTPRQRRPSLRARLHRPSAATRRSWERAPAPYLSDAERAELCGHAVKIAQATSYVAAGTVEFLMDAGHRQVLLHRGEPAHPGRAHRHRAGDRHRHRQGADPSDRGREDRRPRLGRAAAGGDPAERPRAAVPHHHRGPGEQLRSRLRPHHRLSRRHGLRHPSRRRHGLFRRGHHPLLRPDAGEDHRLGTDAGRGDRPHGTAHCASSVSAAWRPT